MTMSNEPETPPGTWYGDWNLIPIFQALQFLRNAHDWCLETAKKLGCPVFKAHPGWRVVLVTDNAAALHLLHTDTTEFDHDEGFLCTMFDWKRMLGNVCPALMSCEGENGEGLHYASRQFIVRSIHHRGYDRFLAVCNEIVREGLPQHQNVASLPLGNALAEVATHIVFKWLMDLDGLPGQDVQDWANAMAYTRADTKLANCIIPAFKRKAGQDMVDYSLSLITRVKESATYPEFVQIGKEVGLPEPNVAVNLLFATMLNACGPCFAVGQPGLANLYLLPELRKRLEKEVDGIYDVEELGKLPLLDAFFYESMRHYGKPSRFARKSLRDTTLPLGDGRVMKIQKGDAVHIVNSAARYDTSVFDNPEVFNPDRFIEDPSLKEKVFPFGDTRTFGRERVFACPGAEAGISSLLWKVSVVCFLRDPNACIKPEFSVVKHSLTNCTSPGDITWNRKL